MIISCSGLLLLYVDGLFVVNPLTRRFQFMDHYGSKLIPEVVGGDGECWKDGTYPKSNFSCTQRAMCIGFTVDRVRAAKRFKIRRRPRTDSRSATEIPRGYPKRPSPETQKESISWSGKLTFNPETEEARLVPCTFSGKPDSKLFLASDDKTNRLTLISGTREQISFYTLDPHEWSLAKRIENVYMEKCELLRWHVVAFDGKRLVVSEKESRNFNGVIHVYDMEANSWGLLGTTYSFYLPGSDIDFFKFTPSFSFLEDDDERKNKDAVASDVPRISYLTAVMGLVDITL
ncbi:unnamed protein product [Thlaspi arvense]|uniref:Uncharacterized protein n=1 Tax=Thlaspi arvense TaxID=13288 RepID=A0AAU9RA16_THLAR|nr:unnamed protein product [Thlaspi arvense]